MAQLEFFPNSYAATRIQTDVSSGAPLLSILNPGCYTDRATAAAIGEKLVSILTVLSVPRSPALLHRHPQLLQPGLHPPLHHRVHLQARLLRPKGKEV